jgi:DNA-directed RNA polymerase specialized sigma24 family protein
VDFYIPSELERLLSAVQHKWRLTPEGFDKFLLSLDPDRNKAGLRYELLRSKLISYFDWRNCPAPEDHADEALNRVIRKVSEGEVIRDTSTYVFGVARMLLMEINRAAEKERSALSLLPAPTVDSESEETQRRVETLKGCLAQLAQPSRDLVVQYYEVGEGAEKIKKRRELADRLGLPVNALRIRVCRLREKLELCLKKHLNEVNRYEPS